MRNAAYNCPSCPNEWHQLLRWISASLAWKPRNLLLWRSTDTPETERCGKPIWWCWRYSSALAALAHPNLLALDRYAIAATNCSGWIVTRANSGVTLTPGSWRLWWVCSVPFPTLLLPTHWTMTFPTPKWVLLWLFWWLVAPASCCEHPEVFPLLTCPKTDPGQRWMDVMCFRRHWRRGIPPISSIYETRTVTSAASVQCWMSCADISTAISAGRVPSTDYPSRISSRCCRHRAPHSDAWRSDGRSLTRNWRSALRISIAFFRPWCRDSPRWLCDGRKACRNPVQWRSRTYGGRRFPPRWWSIPVTKRAALEPIEIVSF